MSRRNSKEDNFSSKDLYTISSDSLYEYSSSLPPPLPKANTDQGAKAGAFDHSWLNYTRHSTDTEKPYKSAASKEGFDKVRSHTFICN